MKREAFVRDIKIAFFFFNFIGWSRFLDKIFVTYYEDR